MTHKKQGSRQTKTDSQKTTQKHTMGRHAETRGDAYGKHRVASRGNTEQTDKGMKENKDYIQTQ